MAAYQRVAHGAAPASQQAGMRCSGAALPCCPCRVMQQCADVPFKAQQVTHYYGCCHSPALCVSPDPSQQALLASAAPPLPARPCRSTITCFRQSARRPHLAAVGLACGTCCTFNLVTHKVGAQRQSAPGPCCCILLRRAGHQIAVPAAADAAAAAVCGLLACCRYGQPQPSP